MKPAKLCSLLFLLLFIAAGAMAATQYWDTASSTGIQGGDGTWSTANQNWSDSRTGTALSVWTAGNNAWFVPPSNGVASMVTVDSSLSVNSLIITGSVYTLIVTNGGTLAGLNSTVTNLFIGAKASNITVIITSGGMITNMGANIGIGAMGNSLIVTNGGSYSSLAALNIGWYGGVSNYVQVVGGAGGNSFLQASNINIGSWDATGYSSGTGNVLTVDGGGVAGSAVVNDLGGMNIGVGGGQSKGGPNCSLIVTNLGRVQLSGDLNVGYDFASNIVCVVQTGRLIQVGSGKALKIGLDSYATPGAISNVVIVNSGGLIDWGGGTISVGSGHFNNSLQIDNFGVVSNVSAFTIGDGVGSSSQCGYDWLRVSTGGKLYTAGAGPMYVGLTANGNTAIISDSGSVWSVGSGLTVGGNGSKTNVLWVQNGGIVTNVTALLVAQAGSGACYDNRLVITNGGKVYSTSSSSIGNSMSTGPNNTNGVIVTGDGSRWDLGSQTLTIGNATKATNNYLTISQSGTVDNVSTLTLAGSLNAVNLWGGTLGVASTTYTNGLFTVGDGVQVATLKSLAGGTLSFTSGLLITNNAILTGIGTVSGAGVGVVLTNGGALNPGLPGGVGTLTIGGSNLTWTPGGIYVCQVANAAGAAGVGYDTLNVTTQLALMADVGSSSLVIRLSSMGVPALNFSATASYNLLVASNATLTGFDSTKFTVNTNDFLNPTAGSWAVMTLNNNLYVTYRPTVEASLSNTWAAPTNGNWTVDGNWVGGLAPSVSSPGMRLTFGGSASDPSYVATNNNSGQFQINRLILTNANATATNLVAGNPLQFWNPDAAIEQWGSGSFRISNSLSLTTNLILRGTGTGTVLVGSNIVGVGALSHLGAATFVLLGSNTFSGPVLMNGLGGTLTMSNVWAFGTNSITVSNGTLCANPGSLTISALTTPRSVQVTGSNSVWTNASALTIGTNVQFTVDTGARLTINGALTVADRGTVVNSLMVTNGGQLFSTAASYIGNANSNNSMLVSGGGAKWDGGGQTLTVGFGAGATNNVLCIDGQGTAGNALVTNMNAVSLGQSGVLIVTNGGQLFSGVGVHYIGSQLPNSTALITGTNSLWNTGGQQITLGYNVSSATNNFLIVTNGGSLYCGVVWVGYGAPYNQYLIASGSVVSNGSINLSHGATDYSNSLTVVNANLMSQGAFIGSAGYGSTAQILSNTLWNLLNCETDVGGGSNNSMVVDNSILTNVGGNASTFIRIGAGSGGNGNSLILTNGAKMFTGTSLTISRNSAPGNSNRVVVTGNKTLLDLGGTYIYIAFLATANGGCTGNVLRIDSGAVVTNAGQGVIIGASSMANSLCTSNGLICLSGGSLFCGNVVVGGSAANSPTPAVGNFYQIDGGTNVCTVANGTILVGAPIGSMYNQMTVTNANLSSGALTVGSNISNNYNTVYAGSGTVWTLAGNSVTVGGAMVANSNNVLTIDKGAVMDNVSSLTVYTNNLLSLKGGTLGVQNTTYTNGLFTVGDGTQATTLKSLAGGTLTFASGLVINTNATLAGIGTVNGSSVGVILTNNATLAPGWASVGTLTIGGSNLTWNLVPGSLYTCEITNMNLGAGLGWDLINVSSQLVLNGSGLLITMDSKGVPATNFDPTVNYNLKILTYGSQTGYDPSKITLDSSAFRPVSAWSLTNFNNALWLQHPGTATPGDFANLVWKVPSNGNWNVTNNWMGGQAPLAGGDPTNVEYFGDNGTPYQSSNNLVGVYTNNKMVFESAYNTTNLIYGNPLAFVSNGVNPPRMDYLVGQGTFIVSNAITFASDSVFGSNGIAGGTVILAGAVTNQGRLTKNGAWTLALRGANNLLGPVVVDSNPGGGLRVDAQAAFNATNLIVSNGTFATTVAFNFGNTQSNLLGQVIGSGSVWTNSGTLQIGSGAGSTNNVVVVNGGGLYAATLTVGSGAGSCSNNLTVNNSGKVTATTLNIGLTASSNNTALVTGSNSLVTATVTVGSGSSWNNLTITNGGGVIGSGNIGATSSSNNTVVITGSNSFWNGIVNLGSGGGDSNILTIANWAIMSNGTYNTAGRFNQVIVTNGGKLYATGSGPAPGTGINVSNSLVVSGTNSLFYCNNSTFGGDTGSLVRIERGANFISAGTTMGIGVSGRPNVGNLFLLTNKVHLVFTATGIAISIGQAGVNNQTMIVTDGSGWTNLAGGAINIGGVGSTNCELRVDGIGVPGGSLITNAYVFCGSTTGGWNRLILTNGGAFYNSATPSIVGNLAQTSNLAQVTGTGSVWNLANQNLTIGYSNSVLNNLLIDNSGGVTNVLNLIIGAGVAASTSLNNSVTLNGGSLYAANILMTNGFANSFTMTGSAQVTVTNQLLAMTAAALNLTGGTLNMRNSMISNGTALVVGNGADGATLSLLPGGINAFANGLVITNNATLAGSSLIMATSTVYGTLSPGMVVGAITNNGDFILKPDATTVIEMTARSTPGAGWDLLAVTNGTLQLGGNLKVLLTGGFTPSSTDSFVIMTNLGPASVSASFASGGQIPVYTNVDWSRVAGIFKVVIGTQGVALNSFALPIDVGTFFIVY